MAKKGAIALNWTGVVAAGRVVTAVAILGAIVALLLVFGGNPPDRGPEKIDDAIMIETPAE